jgi:hypothetical protein
VMAGGNQSEECNQALEKCNAFLVINLHFITLKFNLTISLILRTSNECFWPVVACRILLQRKLSRASV